MRNIHASKVALTVVVVLAASAVLEAHGVSGKDAVFLQGLKGRAIIPLMYLGAKHMVTGYDHLLFLLGVIFFLYRLKDIGLYVTLFAVGHSTTLLIGVMTGVSVSSYLVEASIGLYVVYMSLDNLGAVQRWL